MRLFYDFQTPCSDGKQNDVWTGRKFDNCITVQKTGKNVSYPRCFKITDKVILKPLRFVVAKESISKRTDASFTMAQFPNFQGRNRKTEWIIVLSSNAKPQIIEPLFKSEKPRTFFSFFFYWGAYQKEVIKCANNTYITRLMYMVNSATSNLRVLSNHKKPFGIPFFCHLCTSSVLKLEVWNFACSLDSDGGHLRLGPQSNLWGCSRPFIEYFDGWKLILE